MLVRVYVMKQQLIQFPLSAYFCYLDISYVKLLLAALNLLRINPQLCGHIRPL